MSDDERRRYEWALAWFQFTHQQTYGSNAWALTAAFALFAYVLKDATGVTAVVVATVSAALLASFVGLTSSGWAKERDAAYRTLAEMEGQHGFLIVSRDPAHEVATARRRPALAPMPLHRIILLLMFVIVAGFVVGGAVRVWELAR